LKFAPDQPNSFHHAEQPKSRPEQTLFEFKTTAVIADNQYEPRVRNRRFDINLRGAAVPRGIG
jgi:hypothetical protein